MNYESRKIKGHTETGCTVLHIYIYNLVVNNVPDGACVSVTAVFLGLFWESLQGLKECLCADDNWQSEPQLLWKMLCRIFSFSEATHGRENTVNLWEVPRRAAYATYNQEQFASLGCMFMSVWGWQPWPKAVNCQVACPSVSFSWYLWNAHGANAHLDQTMKWGESITLTSKCSANLFWALFNAINQSKERGDCDTFWLDSALGRLILCSQPKTVLPECRCLMDIQQLSTKSDWNWAAGHCCCTMCWKYQSSLWPTF